jgi:hypothetical protein
MGIKKHRIHADLKSVENSHTKSYLKQNKLTYISKNEKEHISVKFY